MFYMEKSLLLLTAVNAVGPFFPDTESRQQQTMSFCGVLGSKPLLRDMFFTLTTHTIPYEYLSLLYI